MDQQQKLERIKTYVYHTFVNDPTGHDFFHMKRVAHQAKSIAEIENADLFITEAAAWVHDIGDKKLFPNIPRAYQQLEDFLQSIDLSSHDIKLIFKAIENVSFSKGKVPTSLEGKIVQDADRLDAIGAIGVARTFAYGGANGQLIYHDTDPIGTSVQHFYDKLLKLKEQLNTQAAIEIAEKRHQFMDYYLNQFFSEWQ